MITHRFFVEIPVGDGFLKRSFEVFVSKCLDKNVIFDQNENRLSCEEFSLIFINNDNKTQYVK